MSCLIQDSKRAMDTSLCEGEQEGGQQKDRNTRLLLQTSTPFVRLSGNPPRHTTQADTSIIGPLEASSIIAESLSESQQVSYQDDRDSLLTLDSSTTAVRGSMVEDYGSLLDIQTPDMSTVSTGQLNRGFCTEKSVALKPAQEQEGENHEGQVDGLSDSTNGEDGAVVNSTIQTSEENSACGEQQSVGDTEMGFDPSIEESCDQGSVEDQPGDVERESEGVQQEAACEIKDSNSETAMKDNRDKSSSATITSGVAVPTETDHKSPPNEDPTVDPGTMTAAANTTASSIYLSDEAEDAPKKTAPSKPPPKRLTMAQRATMEALASFGGTDLASISVRKRDLRSELKRDAERMKEGDTGNEGPPSKRTRLQRAQEVKPTLSKKTDPVPTPASTSQQPATAPAPPRPHRLTRVERARLEALQSFGGSGFSDVMVSSKRRVARTLEVKKTTGEGEESEEKENEGENTTPTAAVTTPGEGLNQ